MRTEELLAQIKKQLSIFVTEVKSSCAMGSTDINRIAESLLIPILREAYGYQDLKNLNRTSANYPAVDLGDEVRRVAIQVTSTPSTKKVKSTLEKFARHGLEKKFDHVRVYVLTEKQKRYTKGSFENILPGGVRFEAKEDIIDYRDLIREIGVLPPNKLEKILEVLSLNLGYEEAKLQSLQTVEVRKEKSTSLYETNLLNLLEVSFPETLFIAELAIDRGCVIRSSKTLKRNASTRKVALEALHQNNFRFANDWVCHENKLITFHDIREDTPLINIIDRGSVEPFSTNEFYSINSDYENVFKSLGWRCLQQMLYQEGVQWQHKERMFIFTEIDSAPVRKTSWKGSRESHRVVYQRTMKPKDPEKISFCKHFGFRTRYRRFSDDWFLSITPDWFFSFDGYRRSFLNADKVSWLKRHENDRSVLNHLRFIVSFLKEGQDSQQTSLLSKRGVYEFLKFGKLLDFDNAPLLPDKSWLPNGENKETSDTMQIELPLDYEA